MRNHRENGRSVKTNLRPVDIYHPPVCKASSHPGWAAAAPTTTMLLCVLFVCYVCVQGIRKWSGNSKILKSHRKHPLSRKLLEKYSKVCEKLLCLLVPFQTLISVGAFARSPFESSSSSLEVLRCHCKILTTGSRRFLVVTSSVKLIKMSENERLCKELVEQCKSEASILRIMTYPNPVIHRFSQLCMPL